MTIRQISLAALSSPLLLIGCDGGTGLPTTPVAPTPVAQPASPTITRANLANYTAVATVLSRTAGGRGTCGWGTAVGETRAGVRWRITITGDSVSLEQDMEAWPTDHIAYFGTLSGTKLTATYSQGDDYVRWVCQFKGGMLLGRFSADFSSFEAVETLVWGAPEQETAVERHWVGSAIR